MNLKNGMIVKITYRGGGVLEGKFGGYNPDKTEVELTDTIKLDQVTIKDRGGNATDIDLQLDLDYQIYNYNKKENEKVGMFVALRDIMKIEIVK